MPLFLFYGEFTEFLPTKKPSLRANTKQKGRIIIISITKEEALRLNKDFKIKFHEDNGISTTYTKHKKYFLTVNKRNMDALNEIRGINIRKNKPNFRNKRVGV